MPPVPPPAKRRGRAVRRAGTAATGAAIAAGYAVAGRLAPERSARAAARLWCRLPRNRGRRMDNRPSPGEVTRLEVVPGRSLAVEAWGPADGPLVYLNHAWGGWRGQVASFVAPLVRAGCRVIAADCLSHGDADPGRHGPGYSSGGEMVRSLEALVRHYGPARAAIGHSLGCATTCLAAAHGALRAERLVLVAASPAMRRLAREHGRRLHLPSHV
ncbi:MAG: alpha/beta hydrolase, partial [Bifidobacteriaceae bacterium]|nr:alpha/beta hydrolase [Bifidobacteriaceae bacterium]